MVSANGDHAVLVALAAALASPAAAAQSANIPGLLGATALGALITLVALIVARRWRAQRELANLRRTLKAAADWWWRTDTDLQMIEIERGRASSTAPDPHPLLRRKPWQLAGDSDIPSPIAQAIAAQAPFFDVPVAAQLAGDQLTVTLSGTPVLTATDRFAGYVGVTRVVAAAPVADVERLQAEHAGRTRQLELAARELDSFAHSVSHDLRAPLRVVDGFANIVLEDYAATSRPLDDLGREHLNRIVAAAGRMNAMIDTLLALSKMTSRDIENGRVDLSQLARDLAEELRAQDRGRAADFDIADRIQADGDRTLLRLVLQNLLGNAWKFSAKAAQPRIEFAVRSDGGRAVYFVRDNGAGFDMRFADKLFGLFQRFHSQNEFPGTGVGLATVARIVRKHDGRVWAESQPGQGATFFFTLWEKNLRQ